MERKVGDTVERRELKGKLEEYSHKAIKREIDMAIRRDKKKNSEKEMKNGKKIESRTGKMRT